MDGFDLTVNAKVGKKGELNGWVCLNSECKGEKIG